MSNPNVDAEGSLCGRQRRCQTKFYTASWRAGAGWSPTVFAHESPTRSARFDAENDLYSFALTVPYGDRGDAEGSVSISQKRSAARETKSGIVPPLVGAAARGERRRRKSDRARSR